MFGNDSDMAAGVSYFSADFDWEEHREEVEALLQQREASRSSSSSSTTTTTTTATAAGSCEGTTKLSAAAVEAQDWRVGCSCSLVGREGGMMRDTGAFNTMNFSTSSNGMVKDTDAFGAMKFSTSSNDMDRDMGDFNVSRLLIPSDGWISRDESGTFVACGSSVGSTSKHCHEHEQKHEHEKEHLGNRASQDGSHALDKSEAEEGLERGAEEQGHLCHGTCDDERPTAPSKRPPANSSPSTPNPHPAVSSCCHNPPTPSHLSSPSSPTPPLSASPPSPPFPPSSLAPSPHAWELFHTRHSSARFFKPRRYLLAEFPLLLSADVAHLLEIGCGSGSSVLPILKENPNIFVSACDCSSAAVSLTTRAVAQQLGESTISSRFHGFRWDVVQQDFLQSSCYSVREDFSCEGVWGQGLSDDLSDCSCSNQLREILRREQFHPVESSPEIFPQASLPQFDAILLVFVLSAIHPKHFCKVLQRLRSILRPGGYVFFRDYGLYDLPMLRFREDQQVQKNLYMRDDGTLSYFFEKDSLSALFSMHGFATMDSQYCCVRIENRRKRMPMKRVWLHAQFKKTK